jgi:hypothetical protein
MFSFAFNQIKAQDFKTAFKHIEDKNYTDAVKIFSEGLQKNPACPVSNYGFALIHIKNGNLSGYLYAYENLSVAKGFNGDLEEYTKILKVKKIVTTENITSLFNSIDTLLYNEVKNSNNIDSINKYINVRKNSIYIEKVTTSRDSLAFIFAKKENTFKSFEYFVTEYPNAKQITLAKKIKSDLDFNNILPTRDAKEYNRYIKEYPQSEHCSQLNDSIALYEFEEIKTSCTIADLSEFIQNHQTLEKAKSMLYDKEFEIAQKINSLSIYKRYKEKYYKAPKYYISYIDSMIYLKEKLSLTFPNAEKFKIAFLKQENLWIMDEDGTNQIQLTNSSNVFSFIASECSIDKIFYAEIINNSTILIKQITLNRCRNFWDPYATPKFTDIISIAFDEYLPSKLEDFYDFKNIKDEINGLNPKDNVGRMFFSGTSLFFYYQVDVFPGAEYNFYEYGIVSYKKAYEIDVSNKKIVSFYNDPNKRFYRKEYELEQLDIPENSASLDVSLQDYSHLFFKKNESAMDLMFLSSKGVKKIKTFTKEEFGDIKKYYQCNLLNEKTIFNNKTEVGELGDDPNPILINYDGSIVTKLEVFELPKTLLNCNNEVFAFQKDTAYTYSLLTYAGNFNTPIYLVKNISWAEKVGGLSAYYEVDKTIFTRRSKPVPKK